MGTNTAELCAKVIDNAYQVLAILVLALAQATDCLDLRPRLANSTGQFYDAVRAQVAPFVEDRPHYEEIQTIIRYLKQI